MKSFLPWIKLPIKTAHLIVGTSLLLIFLWAQNGFKTDGVHIIFLLSNYSVWLLILPWVFGWVVTSLNATTNWGWLIFSMLILLVIQWTLSNTILYCIKSVVLDHGLLPTKSEIAGFLLPSIISRLVDFAVLAGILIWIQQQRQIALQQIDVVEKEAEIQANKLKALRSQLNPHFLFNALHTISSLIGRDDTKAQSLTIRMSQLMRRMLEINEKETHPFAEEIDFILDYLSIESERFHDRLTVELKVDQSVREIIVPTMILQPLIENAFKYGISQIPDSSILFVSVTRVEKTIEIIVKNDVPSKPNKVASTGMGLKNLESRIKAYYRDTAKLLVSRKEKEFEAHITLPTND